MKCFAFDKCSNRTGVFQSEHLEGVGVCGDSYASNGSSAASIRFRPTDPGNRLAQRGLATGCLVFVLIVSWTLLDRQAAADDWPCWRGPNQNGSIDASGQFSGKSFGLEILWKKSLGAGYSAVSIMDGKVLATFTDGKDNLVGAFDTKTGELLWQYRLGAMYKAHDGGHDGPVSTPVADGDTVFALNTNGLLVALDLEDGRERWTESLVEKFGAHVPFWGLTTTPVIYGDSVIVQVGGGNGSGLVAFDKRDGRVVWRRGGGRVDYRSPVLAQIHGRPHLIVSNSRTTDGIDPKTGQQLWTRGFVTGNDKTPLHLGDNRVLLTGRGGCELIEIPQQGKHPERVWNSSELRGNYDTPVRHRNYLYGFTGRWLTCVEVTTGRRCWRSRHPGGKGLILVDGHLVVFGGKGDVVVVEATHEQYREKARLSVSDADGYASPSFADGIIFVRNLQGDLIAVRTVDRPHIAETQPGAPSHAFAAFVQRLADSDDKKSLLDEFMKAQSSFPIVEDDRLVHFVYRGPAKDVGIRGTMIAQGEEDSLDRVAGTDLFHRTYEIVPGSRWEYQFTVDFDRTVRDPLNPRRAPGSSSSEVKTSGWTQPDFVESYEGTRAGRLETLRFDGGSAQVYLPHGYDRGGARYPLVIVNDGSGWQGQGRMANTLNQLGDRFDTPPIVAFVSGGGNRALGGAGTRGYARRLAEQLVPALDRRYRTRANADSRTIFGKRGGAVAAVYTALQYPQLFGHCVAISYGRADTVRADLIAERIREKATKKPRFYITWNRYEVWRPQSFDCRQQSRELKAALEQGGYEVLGNERLDSASWRSWQIQAGQALVALLARAE